jgi:hypothetical protein
MATTLEIVQVCEMLDAIAVRTYRRLAQLSGEGKVCALWESMAAEASAALAHLRSRLDATLQPVKWEEGLLVFKDAKGRFGRAASDGPRLTVTLGLTEP